MNEILQDSNGNFIRDLCPMCFYIGVGIQMKTPKFNNIEVFSLVKFPPFLLLLPDVWINTKSYTLSNSRQFWWTNCRIAMKNISCKLEEVVIRQKSFHTMKGRISFTFRKMINSSASVILSSEMYLSSDQGNNYVSCSTFLFHCIVNPDSQDNDDCCYSPYQSQWKFS